MPVETCEACGEANPGILPVNVEYPDGTPTTVRACAKCRANPPERET